MRYPVSRPRLDGAEDLLRETVVANWVSSGPLVRQFEAELGRRLDVPAEHVVATTSGTTALHLALAALGIQAGDEVIVPDLTYIATANAVVYCGARPVFVDVSPATWCLDVARVERAITRRTKAIIPVHLYGAAADMLEIRALAQQHHLAVVEDAAQGFAGHYMARPLGAIGDIGCFSFFANKILATGEGGACVVQDPQLARRLRALGGMAQGEERYRHTMVGFNYRFTDVQAALGLAQLARLEEYLAARWNVFSWYRSRLWQHVTTPWGVTAPWMFTCLLPIKRAPVIAHLATRGIDTRPVFVPMHEHAFFRWSQACPVSSFLSRQGISLPTYVGLTQADVDYICDALLEVVP